MRQVGGWKPSEIKIHSLGMVIHRWENNYHCNDSPQRVRGLSPHITFPILRALYLENEPTEQQFLKAQGTHLQENQRTIKK